MTDKTVLVGGRLFFEGGLIGPRPGPLDRRWGIGATYSPHNPMALAEMAYFIGRDPIPLICGYHPQRLLPAPDYWDVRRWNEPGADPIGDIAEIMRQRERVHPHRVAVVNVDRLTADLLRRVHDITGVRGVIINIDTPSGELLPDEQYWKQVYGAMIERHKLRAKEARAKPRPEYLKHDPTKRHGRRRR